MSWLTQGASSAAALQQEKVKQEARRNETGKMYRFRLKEGEEARITFVDGFLAPDGMNKGCLTFASYHEHTIQANGGWHNYVCLHGQGDMHCPLCEEGNRSSFVGALTVIDHREVTSKDGTKTYKDQKRLFVAKSTTLQMLTQLAAKRGGLAGCTFDVYRTSKTDASVGNIFDFIEKNDVEELKKQFTNKNEQGKDVTYFTAAEYDKELPFFKEAELRGMGFGTKSIGNEPPLQESGGTDYSGDL